MKKIAAAAVLGALVLASCAKKEEASAIDTSLPMKDVMGHVIDAGAQTFWKSSGSYVDETGEHSYVPTDEDGWHAAESGVATVVEGANLLLIGDRQRDDGDWVKMAVAMRTEAEKARQAVIAQDADKMFETGASLYQTCVACHEKYVVPFLDEEGNMKLSPKGEPLKK